MVWIDQIALPALIAIPLIGALFLRFIPEYESILRKRVAIFSVLIAILLHARNTRLLFNGKFLKLDLEALRPSFLSGELQLSFDFITCIGLSFLFGVSLMLLFCRLSYANLGDTKLGSKILFTLSLANAVLLCRNFGLSLLLQFALIQMLLIFNLGGSQPHRNSSNLAAALFFTAVDLGAFFVWTFNGDLLIWISPELLTILLFGPAISRLLVPFFSPWARAFFENASIEITALITSTGFILAGSALARSSLESSWLSSFAVVSGLLAVILAISDKPSSSFVLRLATFGSSLALFLFAKGLPNSKLSILIHVCSLALITSFALLVARGLQSAPSGEKQGTLVLLWYTSLVFLFVVELRMYTTASVFWAVNFCIAGLAASMQLRIPVLAVTQPQMLRVVSARLSFPVLANAWACMVLIALTLFIFFFFPMAVIPS